MCKKRERRTRRMQIRGNELQVTVHAKKGKKLHIKLTARQMKHLRALKSLEQICKVPAGHGIESIMLKMMTMACRHAQPRRQ